MVKITVETPITKVKEKVLPNKQVKQKQIMVFIKAVRDKRNLVVLVVQDPEEEKNPISNAANGYQI